MNSVEIAKLAGVSRSTVSRVINNYPNVPEETREKVLEVIKQYNYVPHASARMLAGKTSNIIGLIVVDTKGESEDNKVYSSSYFSQFISIVIDKAKKQGYHVLVSEVSKAKDFQSVKDIFYNKTIAGGIFIGARDNDQDIREIIAEGQKVAIVGQSIEGSQEEFGKCLIVNPDNYGGTVAAMEFMMAKGLKNIAHISGDLKQLSAIERLEGYKASITKAGMQVKSNLILKGDFTEESGYRSAKKLLTKMIPQGVFAANDHMAIGAIRAIEEEGLRVPEDISVIGFDDIEAARYVRPSLTTVRISLLEVASIVTGNLIRAIEENSPVWANYKVPVELVERESCTHEVLE